MATEIGRDELGSSTQGAYRTRGDTGATDEAQRLADVGKAEAKAIWEDTKASVRSALNEKQSSTAADIGELAGALRNAARGINQDRPVAHIAAHAADSLDRLSGTLRNKDFDRLMHEVQSFARSQPAVFLGMAVAAGFLATRFLKSSASHTDIGLEPERRRYDTGPDRATSIAGSEPPFPYDPRRT